MTHPTTHSQANGSEILHQYEQIGVLQQPPEERQLSVRLHADVYPLKARVTIIFQEHAPPEIQKMPFGSTIVAFPIRPSYQIFEISLHPRENLSEEQQQSRRTYDLNVFVFPLVEELEYFIRNPSQKKLSAEELQFVQYIETIAGRRFPNVTTTQKVVAPHFETIA